MNATRITTAGLVPALLVGPDLPAEEYAGPAMAGLELAAADFVVADNDRKAGAIAALFTGKGEMTDPGWHPPGKFLSGETIIANQELVRNDKDTLPGSATNKVGDAGKQPGMALRGFASAKR